MEFVIRGPNGSTNEHNGPILTLSGADAAGEERFIAVTPQEEMLLAAMRAKRALMRENMQNGDVEAGARSKAASKKQSLSNVKTSRMDSLHPAPLSCSSHARNSTKKLATALQFPEPPASRTASAPAAPQPVEIPEEVEEENILMCLDRAVSSSDAYEYSEPSPDLTDFIIDFDADQFPTPPKATHSRNSSTASAAGRLTHAKSSFGRPRPDSEFLPRLRAASPEAAPPLPSQSPVARTEQLNSPPPPSRKKAVRISAVGLTLPEIGQWGDDG